MYAVLLRALTASPIVASRLPKLIGIINKGKQLTLKGAAELWDWAKRDKANLFLILSSLGAMGVSLKEIFSSEESKAALAELGDAEMEAMVIEHGRGALMGAQISPSTRAVIEANSDARIKGLGSRAAHNEIVDIMQAPRAILGSNATAEQIVKLHDRLRAFIELPTEEVQYGAALRPLTA